MKQCECGWKRPLISLTTLEGPMAPANVVPVYNCPCCGMSYVPKELPEGIARRILRDLMSHRAPPSSASLLPRTCIVCDALAALDVEKESPSEGPFPPIENVLLGGYFAGIVDGRRQETRLCERHMAGPRITLT